MRETSVLHNRSLRKNGMPRINPGCLAGILLVLFGWPFIGVVCSIAADDDAAGLAWATAIFVNFAFWLGLALYFWPTAFAIRRNVVHKSIIILLNVLLGWTVLGWLVALIWALVDTRQDALIRTTIQPGNSPVPQKTCPNCYRVIGQTATKCPHCKYHISGQRMKVCPLCAEEILYVAVFCRYCRSDLPDEA